MKKVTEPGTYLMWDGKLVQVVAIGERKTIHMRPVGATPCDKCGRMEEFSALEDSPLFQDSAEPVPTITDPKRSPLVRG